MAITWEDDEGLLRLNQRAPSAVWSVLSENSFGQLIRDIDLPEDPRPGVTELREVGDESFETNS